VDWLSGLPELRPRPKGDEPALALDLSELAEAGHRAPARAGCPARIQPIRSRPGSSRSGMAPGMRCVRAAISRLAPRVAGMPRRWWPGASLVLPAPCGDAPSYRGPSAPARGTPREGMSRWHRRRPAGSSPVRAPGHEGWAALTAAIDPLGAGPSCARTTRRPAVSVRYRLRPREGWPRQIPRPGAAAAGV